MLCFMHDVMVIHHDSLSILAWLDKYFKLKPSSVGDPTMYLGATVKKMTLDNRVLAWASSPAKYV